MKIKKSLAILATIPLLLTACFGGEDASTTDNAGNQQNAYVTNDFSINLANDWEVLTRDNLGSNIPNEFLVGFVSPIKNEIFTSNIAVSKKAVSEGLSSTDFGKGSISAAKKLLASFQEISSETISLDDGTEIFSATYEGRQNTSAPLIRFQNLFIVKNGFAFSVTGAYALTEDESIVNAVGEMLDSFKLN